MVKLIFVVNFLFFTITFAQTENDELFAEVEALLNQAKIDNADVLCAEAYSNAVEEYKTAYQLNADGEPPIDIKEKLESSISYLTEVNNNIEAKQEVFSSIIDKRNSALDSEANKTAVYYWELGENKFQETIEKFEDGDTHSVSRGIKTTEEYYTNSKLYADKAKALVNSESVKEAIQKEAYLTAPISYEKAEEKMFETLDLISSGKRLSKINKSITDTELLFDMTSINATKFSDEYPELLALRSDAKLVDAEKYTFELWEEAEELLREAAENFEDEDYDDAEELAKKASDKYVTAKQISLKDYFLTDAKNEIDLAIDEGAEEFAPKTLKRSQEYLAEVASLIESNTYSLPKIKKLTKESILSAKNARRITEIAKRMEPGDDPWEDVILAKEGYLIDDNEEDFQDVQDNYNEEADYSDLAEKLQMSISDDVQIELGDEKLILRFKNVKFATMSSQLNKKSKESLDRIFNELKDESFSEATIVCYTDNVGTKSTNKAISQKRAEAVLNYVMQIDNSHEYYFEGRGEENPIATNLTSEGRERNRRVELEIK